jgi:3-hydroxyisobutyrate dehydrogenase-like beta-hydroxyacid dehydrogenase
MRVAFLGLGQMGGHMCDHVIAGGHDVTVFDPYPPAVEPRAKAGAKVAATPAAAARDAEAICVVVRTDEQALESIAGPDGVLEGASAGAIVMLHSTVAPETVRRLHAACVAKGVRFIDAGISGGEPGSLAGTLYLICGGDQATIDDAKPVLQCFAGHVVRFGDIGAGMAAKLARNMLQYTMWVASHEAIALAEAAGIDFDAFAHLIRETDVKNTAEFVFGRGTTALFDEAANPEAAAIVKPTIGLGFKDLKDAFLLADEVGAEVVLARDARPRFGYAMGLAISPDDSV